MHYTSVLTRLVERMPNTKLSNGIPLLQYTDDITVFIEVSVEETKELSTLSDIFVDFWELQINRTQSAFLGFGLTQEEELQCSEALGTPSGSLPMQYLGLPLRWKRMSVHY